MYILKREEATEYNSTKIVSWKLIFNQYHGQLDTLLYWFDIYVNWVYFGQNCSIIQQNYFKIYFKILHFTERKLQNKWKFHVWSHHSNRIQFNP